ncbi:hypothetical protein E7V67_021910 [[Empedobacter] haloabium]|uniref:Glutathionylspermidine synthase family protein n=1 Tax=[Empedobacter] haloabium TaxID=592317 RepID=A0ABZ1UI18_9BURK
MIDATIIEHHRRMSQTAADFIDYAVSGNSLGRLSELGQDVHPMFRDYPYALHAWPWFLGPAMRERLRGSVERIPALLNRAILAEFDGAPDELADYYGVPGPVAHLFVELGSETPYMLQRTDAVLTATGMKIVELNVGSSIGGWQIHWMDRHYRQQEGLVPFLARHECRTVDIPDAFMGYLIGAMRDKGFDTRVLFLITEEFERLQGHVALREIFERTLARCGGAGEILFARTADGLEGRADGVYLDGSRLGAVMNSRPDNQVLARAAVRGQILWPDNPFDAVLGDKRSLSILYQHKDTGLFDAAERALIEEFVPWSVALTDTEVEFEGTRMALPALLREQRHRFVIKTAVGQQGDDVFIGKFTDAAEWAEVVERGLREPGWLVQEFCVSLPFYGQHGEQGYGIYDVVWGIFGFGDSYGGCWLRLMEKDSGNGVINSAKGAQEAIVYDVDR